VGERGGPLVKIGERRFLTAGSYCFGSLSAINADPSTDVGTAFVDPRPCWPAENAVLVVGVGRGSSMRFGHDVRPCALIDRAR